MFFNIYNQSLDKAVYAIIDIVQITNVRNLENIRQKKSECEGKYRSTTFLIFENKKTMNIIKKINISKSNKSKNRFIPCFILY